MLIYIIYLLACLPLARLCGQPRFNRSITTYNVLYVSGAINEYVHYIHLNVNNTPFGSVSLDCDTTNQWKFKA